MEPQQPSGAETPQINPESVDVPDQLQPSKEQLRPGSDTNSQIPAQPLPVDAGGTPVATPDPQTPNTPALQPDSNPAIADDVDVIEKEWVDKAKEVIREHQDDPWTEEEAVEDLQIDYLKKRYGKDLDKPNKEG